MTMKQETPAELVHADETSTADLVRDALTEAKELVRLEVAIAKDEAKKQVREAKTAAIAFGVAVVAALLVLSTLMVALVIAFGGTALAALLVAAGLLVVAGVAGWVGYAKLPKKPLEQTLENVKRDVNQLKEHFA